MHWRLATRNLQLASRAKARAISAQVEPLGEHAPTSGQRAQGQAARELCRICAAEARSPPALESRQLGPTRAKTSRRSIRAGCSRLGSARLTSHSIGRERSSLGLDVTFGSSSIGPNDRSLNKRSSRAESTRLSAAPLDCAARRAVRHTSVEQRSWQLAALLWAAPVRARICARGTVGAPLCARPTV